jgi:hypothetical protein
MADIGLPGMGTINGMSALLFLTSGMTTLDAYSTFQSSPWTIENFGADEEKTKACKEYLTHAVVFSLAYSAASAYLSDSMWPLLGSAIANAYLIWLYTRAMTRGGTSGSAGWSKG